MSEYARILAKFYAYGGLSLKEIFDLTTQKKLTKEEFHFITELDYNGIKKSQGW